MCCSYIISHNKFLDFRGTRLQQTVGSVPVESTPLVKKLEQSHPHLKALPIFAGETQEGRLMVGKEKFEMSELCQMFMGNHWKHFFTLLIALYTYGWCVPLPVHEPL